MSRSTILSVAFAVVAGLSGCASPARIVHQEANSVTIAIPENSNTWPTYYRDEARKMAATAIPNPVIQGGGEVKVGQTVTSSQNTDRRDIGGNVIPKIGEVSATTNSTTVQDKKEFHLTFVSGPSNPTPAPTNNSAPPIPGGSPVTPAGGVQPKKNEEPRATVPPVNIPGNAPRGNFPTTGLQ